MKSETFNTDYFIRKFEGIEEDLFIIDSTDNGKGGHCALGWCLVNGRSSEINRLVSIFHKFLNQPVYVVNNGWDKRYPQPTPKQRILAALYDIKALEEKKERLLNEPPIDELIKNIPERELILE